MINCVFFDWSSTLAKFGQREIFMYHSNLKTRLETLDPHALGILGYLHSKGIKIGIITNTKKDPFAFKRAINETRLSQFIDPELVFSSSDPRYCEKPCSQIFMAALEKAGCIVSESLYVGDSCWADVQGAQAIGMPVVHINPGGYPCIFGGSRIENLSQLVYIV